MNLLRRTATRSLALVATLAVSITALGAVSAPPAAAAVGDDVIAWLEVEDGAITGGPPFNSGNHGNFSGTGYYTFRESGMMSTMTVNAPAAGVYPVHVRYAAGPLSAGENVTRSMGLLTNGGARQQMSLPMTSVDDWESWAFVTHQVTLNQGPNTIAVQCNRDVDFCRLNFDAIQVGGTVPDPCVATPPLPGYQRMFDGTFATLQGWRKGGTGGFGRQTDCTIRGFGGRGAAWFTQQQSGRYTLRVDWRRGASVDQSSVYLASTGRGGADPSGGFRIPIGPETGAITPTGGSTQAADPAAVEAALAPIGQWNTYEIEVTESRVRVSLNGTVVNTLVRPGTISTTGFIGLENRSAGSSVSFRNVQIQPDVVLAELAAPLDRARLGDGTVNLGGESTLGNLVADAQRWATRAGGSGSAQIALVSPTSLAADLRGTTVGDATTVTYGQAAQVQTSTDPLVNLRLTGEQLRTVLEQQWQRTADDAAPAHPFLRLGTSADFSYTYDPTAAEGSRVTGMWLGSSAIAPTTAYSVTVSSALASGADNFRVLAEGTNRRVTAATAPDALVGYLAEFADVTAGRPPLAVETEQGSVGVSFPGGARESYVAGGPFEVDLSSLAFSGAADPKDTAVEVTLGNQPLGTFAVDNTLGTETHDEYGRAAVRATIPLTAGAGRATVRIVGTTSGTSVRFPITVTAAPPKAVSTTSVRVAPAAVAVRRGSASVTVSVTSPGATPTGQVEILVNGVRSTVVALSNGRATASVGPFSTAGARSVTARYLGDDTTRPSASPAATVSVAKIASAVTVKVQPKRVTATKVRAKVTVAVRAAGVTPSGKVRLKVGKKTYTGTLRNGRVTIRLARFARAGTVRATATYLGDALTATSSRTAKITVTKPRRR